MSRPSCILITGASSGIGAALALAYAREGITLLLMARHEERLNDVAHSRRARGATVHVAIMDVREKEKLAEWILRMDDHHPVDLLVANAGISPEHLPGMNPWMQQKPCSIKIKVCCALRFPVHLRTH